MTSRTRKIQHQPGGRVVKGKPKRLCPTCNAYTAPFCKRNR